MAINEREHVTLYFMSQMSGQLGNKESHPTRMSTKNKEFHFKLIHVGLALLRNSRRVIVRLLLVACTNWRFSRRFNISGLPGRSKLLESPPLFSVRFRKLLTVVHGPTIFATIDTTPIA